MEFFIFFFIYVCICICKSVMWRVINQHSWRCCDFSTTTVDNSEQSLCFRWCKFLFDHLIRTQILIWRIIFWIVNFLIAGIERNPSCDPNSLGFNRAFYNKRGNNIYSNYIWTCTMLDWFVRSNFVIKMDFLRSWMTL